MNVNMKTLEDRMIVWTEKVEKLENDINYRFFHPVQDEAFKEDAAKATKWLNKNYEHYTGLISRVEFTLDLMGLRWNKNTKKVEPRWED